MDKKCDDYRSFAFQQNLPYYSEEEDKKPNESRALTKKTESVSQRTITEPQPDVTASGVLKGSFYKMIDKACKHSSDPSFVDNVVQLKPSSALTKVTQKATSPKIFFTALGAKRIEKQFSQDDIDHIYTMMENYPMCTKIYFYSIFGMEMFCLLKDLKTLVNTSGQEIQKKARLTEQKWSACYIQSCVNSQTNVQLLDEINGIVQEILKNFKDDSNNEAEIFSQKWNKTYSLLRKFFICKQAEPILFNRLICECLGVDTIMKFSSFNEMQNARKLLCNYISTIADSFRIYKVIHAPKDTTVLPYENILKEIRIESDQHNFDESQDIDQVELQCGNLLRLINQKIDALKEISEPGNVCHRFLVEFRNVLMKSIVPCVPSLQIEEAHKSRFEMNFYDITLNFETYVSIDKKIAPPWFRDNYNPFCNMLNDLIGDLRLCNLEITDDLEWGGDKLYKHYEDFKDLRETLGETTDTILTKLLESAQKHANTVSKLPLLKMTNGLARVLILIYDIDMMLDGESSWSCELPDKYLEFLCMEQGAGEPSFSIQESLSEEFGTRTSGCSSRSDSEPKVLAPTDEFLPEGLTAVTDLCEMPQTSECSSSFVSGFSELNLNEQPKSPKSEIKEPPKSLSSNQEISQTKAVSSVVAPHKPKIEQPASNDSSSQSTNVHIDLKHLRKVWQLERVLGSLGLVRIEGKRHTKYLYPVSEKNPNGDLVAATVPRHPGEEIRTGTLIEIEREVNNNLERKLPPAVALTQIQSSNRKSRGKKGKT